MASCSQVSSFFQAHVDGELEMAESQIVDSHLSDCAACRMEVDQLIGFNERLVRACSMHQLQGSLRDGVLAHLPVMEPALNHGSHPTDPGLSRKKTRAHWPTALAAGIAILIATMTGFALRDTTQPAPRADSIGMIVFADGPSALRLTDGATQFTPVALQEFVMPGDELETLEDTRVTVALARGSSLKLNAESHVSIDDMRKVFVHRGQAYFDVGRARRHFFVNTPTGEILVFGTTFVVDVQTDATTVTVIDGDVIVSTAKGRSALSHGKQSTLRLDSAPTPPKSVDTAVAGEWTRTMHPDPDALSEFQTALATSGLVPVAIPAEAVYAVRNLRDREIVGISLTWEHDGYVQNHCGYFLHVTDSADNLLILDTITGAQFNDPSVDSFTIAAEKGPITGIDVIHIRLIPDYSSGTRETTPQVNAVVQ